ncbi:hypothetical protein L1887_52033 [Cichorium endivia]|nr:hypothetical protein L1887_52033 [Cichorium endivia]
MDGRRKPRPRPGWVLPCQRGVERSHVPDVRIERCYAAGARDEEHVDEETRDAVRGGVGELEVADAEAGRCSLSSGEVRREECGVTSTWRAPAEEDNEMCRGARTSLGDQRTKSRRKRFLTAAGKGKGRRSRGAGDRKMHTRLTTALHGRAVEL